MGLSEKPNDLNDCFAVFALLWTARLVLQHFGRCVLDLGRDQVLPRLAAC